MPIYEYQCVQCNSILEIFQHSIENSPKICGHRCAIGPEDDAQEHRGMGSLQRQISSIGGNVRAFVKRDKPTLEEAGRAGFQVYQNEGNEQVSQISGPIDPNFPSELLKKK